MKYTVIIPRCGGGAAYEGDPAVGCVREDVEILNGHGTNPGNARNDALNRASGEWIVFCDADDRLLPEVLPLLDRMTSEHPSADMVKYAWRRNGASVPIRAFIQYAYRRSSLGGIRFPDLCMGEDLLYLEHCLRHASEIAETDEFGYEQIVNDRSLTRRRPTRQIVLDTITYATEYLKLIGTGQPLTSMTRFGLTTLLTEHVSSWIFKLPSAERQDCWKAWFAAIHTPELHFTRWGAFGRSVLRICPTRLLAYLLFVLPHRLKQGLNTVRQAMRLIARRCRLSISSARSIASSSQNAQTISER